MSGRELAVLLATFSGLVGCTDVRDFEGQWSGERVGQAEALRVGFADQTSATLEIESLDLRTIRAELSTEGGVFDGAAVEPVAGAEADVLAGISFDGSPSRVYLSFVAAADGGGSALAVIALYEGDRIELRILRGEPNPLYGIFALDRAR